MIVKIIRPSLTKDELQKRLDEISKIAGIIVKDTYEKEYVNEVQKNK